MAMIKWIITTAEKYAGLLVKDSNALYFLQDTQEIYKGETSFTQPTSLVANFPEKGALGRVYINQTTLEGKVWTGTQWRTVIQPVAQTMTGAGGETTPVSGDAVKAYVATQLAQAITGNFVDGITYDKTTKQLKYTKGEAETTVDIAGFVTGASYAGDTGILTFQVQGGEAIQVNLPKENFVKSGKYDAVEKDLVLTLQDGSEIRIPADDLIDSSEFVSSETVSMAAGEDGLVKAEVKISATAGNALTKNADGLYVAPTDISNKLDKVATAKEGEIIIAKADGTVAVSGVKAGAATLNVTPNATTLATEAAVNAIKTALENTIATKVSASAISTSIGTSAASSDSKVASEKAVATAIEAVKAGTVAKTAMTNTISAESNSADKVVTEQAVVAAMSWGTIV